MIKNNRHTLIKELLWLVMIILLSLLLEFTIIYAFDLHPVLKIKIQGFVGLLILGYAIRMGSRVWVTFHEPSDPVTNGQHKAE